VQEHQKHLGLVLREHKLYLREEKCELFMAKVNCLGHMIDEKGLHTDANKMAKICDWNRPCKFEDVQRFLGLVQYLAHFLPDITSYTGPLASMMMNGTPFYWKPLHEKCFQMIKAICCRMPILCLIETKKDEPIWVTIWSRSDVWPRKNLADMQTSRLHVKKIHRCSMSLLSIHARNAHNIRSPPEMGEQTTRILHTCGNGP